MKNIIITFSFLLTCNLLFAQHAKMVTSGKVEYAKRINMYAMYRQELGNKLSPQQQDSYDRYVQSFPQQFVELKSTLVFNKDKSLFTPIETDPPPTVRNMGNNPMAKQFNIIYTNTATQSSVAQKDIYGTTYLLKDSTHKITWRLTNETREIAGYACRRANGLTADSVYLVAFFTDKIWFSGGPESFSGLPGMILQLAVPHENVVWTVTKVTDEPIPSETIAEPQPKKAKTVNNKQLKETLKEGMKMWGASGPYEMKIFMM